jgi:hypothetical protein
MRADVQAVVEGWRRLNAKEARRLAGLSVVEGLDGILGSEPATWFQQVEWWPATVVAPEPAAAAAAAAAADDIFGGSILGFSTADEAPSGRPDSGLLVLTGTRLLLIGEWTRSGWPLASVQRFTFVPGRFVQSTAAHFELRTPEGLHRLLPGRGVPHQPMLDRVAESLARVRSAPPPPVAGPRAETSSAAGDASGSTVALLAQLEEMRDRGTITQTQFESERERLLR